MNMNCVYHKVRAQTVAKCLRQAHDKTLVSINNHLVNGKGNDLDGGLSGGGQSGGRLNSLKEEILRELERRVSLSCSSCQVLLHNLI